MPTKIRLQRHGRKGKPFYWIVVADSRAKRDGKFIEKIGTYNPVKNPAIINLDIDTAADWLGKGAQPTETAKRLLSYKGALLKHHLSVGVRKGAHTQEQADAKLAEWLKNKEKLVSDKVAGLSKAEQDAKAKIIANEKQYRENKLKGQEEEVAVAEPVAEEAPVEETKTEETPKAEAEEAPKAEEAPAETEEAPKEEKE